MKVKIIIPDFPFISDPSDQIKFDIDKKFQKIIDLPILPTKEMQIWLDSILDLYELNESEWMHINDGMYYDINEFIVCSTYVELWLIQNDN